MVGSLVNRKIDRWGGITPWGGVIASDLSCKDVIFLSELSGGIQTSPQRVGELGRWALI